MALRVPEFSLVERNSIVEPFPTKMVADVFSDNTAGMGREEDEEDYVRYQLLQRPEPLPKFSGAQLHIMYGYEKAEADKRLIAMVYHEASNDTTIATFIVRRNSDDEFELNHRLVEPQYQGDGIGSAALERAEQLMQQMADHSKQRLSFKIPVGQRNVMKWVENNGYTPEDDEAQTRYDHIKEHPEAYEFGNVAGDDGYLRKDYVYKPGTKKRTMATAERITFIKEFNPKLEVVSD